MSRSIPTEDRISSLPDPIICHILSFLPTKHAATTSILSKRWNPLWLSVSTLHFDDETFKDFISFRHFVSSVFLLRDNTLPIRSFHIKCSKASNLHLHDINPFVHAAAQRGIENLILKISGMLTLPRSIFNCRTLVVLHLKGLKVNDLSHVIVDFPLLKSLYLCNVLLERPDYLLQLVLGCPILEELQLENLRVHNNEWLVLPKTYFERQKFQSLPKLIIANITKSPASLTLLLTLLCREESQVLRADVDARFLRYLKFHNLTYMELILKHNHCEKWKWLLEVLKGCPKLQNLTIHQDFRNGDEVVDNWMNPTIVPECLSTQLTTCCLKGFKCTECEFQFAKYVMQNSKVLNTMSIESTSSVDINVKYHMITKLASSTRASSACKLLFH